MFIIECLHPDGWRQKGRTAQEYWAYQEAQDRPAQTDGHTGLLMPQVISWSRWSQAVSPKEAGLWVLATNVTG